MEMIVEGKGVARLQLIAGMVTDAYLNTNEASNEIVLDYGQTRKVM